MNRAFAAAFAASALLLSPLLAAETVYSLVRVKKNNFEQRPDHIVQLVFKDASNYELRDPPPKVADSGRYESKRDPKGRMFYVFTGPWLSRWGYGVLNPNGTVIQFDFPSGHAPVEFVFSRCPKFPGDCR